MNYTLFNKTNEVYLTHPKVGMWFTDNEKEAQEMLEACVKYLESVGIEAEIEIKCLEKES